MTTPYSSSTDGLTLPAERSLPVPAPGGQAAEGWLPSAHDAGAADLPKDESRFPARPADLSFGTPCCPVCRRSLWSPRPGRSVSATTRRDAVMLSRLVLLGL